MLLDPGLGWAVDLSKATGRLMAVVDPVQARSAEPEKNDDFTERSARAALADASTAVGLDSSGAELIRLGENAVFRLASRDVVARVGRSAGRAADVSRQLAVARWLMRNGVPAIRAIDVEQPVVARGRIV